MALRFEALVIDCGDTQRVGAFWAALLGRQLTGPDGDGNYFIEATDVSPELFFARVPEGKTVKNRLHIDLRPDDQAAEVERATALGAHPVDVGQGDVSWVVLADPEGNEFCILRSRQPADN